MYPDLSYVFHDLFGTELDNWASIFKTFGLFLVFAILSAAFLLFKELKRKTALGFFTGRKVKVVTGRPASVGELISNAVFGLFLGLKVPYIAQNFGEFQNDAAAVIFSTKGNWAIGIALAAIFAGYRWWEKNKDKTVPPKETIETQFPHDRIADITIMAAISGVAGAKIFALIEDLPAFFADPMGMFFSGSGLAIYGGLIGGTIGVMWYLKKLKIPVLPLADAVAPALIISYGVGRLGCHFSGDGDWGIVAAAMPEWWMFPDWLWSQTYPRNVNNDGGALLDAAGYKDYAVGLIQGCDVEAFKAARTWPIENWCEAGCGQRYCHELKEGVYPTSVYEVMMTMVIGAILWALRKRVEYYIGMLISIYLMFNGLERFLIEKIRVNIKYDGYLNFTQAEIIAIILFLMGLIGAIIVWRRGPQKPEFA